MEALCKPVSISRLQPILKALLYMHLYELKECCSLASGKTLKAPAEVL